MQVVLPEGASRIEASVPFEVQKAFDTKFTYLDTAGRPVLVLRKAHVTPEHATKFNVDYAFASTGILREPLLLIAGEGKV